MSEYDEVNEVIEEIPILEIKPIRDFVWCGLLEQRRDKILCRSLRTKDRTRVQCGYLNEAGGCDFITKEERLIRDKAAREAAEDEMAEKINQEGTEAH